MHCLWPRQLQHLLLQHLLHYRLPRHLHLLLQHFLHYRLPRQLCFNFFVDFLDVGKALQLSKMYT